jgi:hypothetical protein
VAVAREHRRAKTDRGCLRGERNHCKMCAIPTIAEEDAKAPTASARPSLKQAPKTGPNLYQHVRRLDANADNTHQNEDHHAALTLPRSG